MVRGRLAADPHRVALLLVIVHNGISDQVWQLGRGLATFSVDAKVRQPVGPSVSSRGARGGTSEIIL